MNLYRISIYNLYIETRYRRTGTITIETAFHIILLSTGLAIMLSAGYAREEAQLITARRAFTITIFSGLLIAFSETFGYFLSPSMPFEFQTVWIYASILAYILLALSFAMIAKSIKKLW